MENFQLKPQHGLTTHKYLQSQSKTIKYNLAIKYASADQALFLIIDQTKATKQRLRNGLTINGDYLLYQHADEDIDHLLIMVQ